MFKNVPWIKILLIVFIVIVSSFYVFAAYGVPHQFYGDVTVNGAPAPNNLLIEARIQGAVFSTFTNNGEYGYDPIFYIEDPNNNRIGESITFFVGTNTDNLVQAQSRLFSNGVVSRLDLVVSNLDIPTQSSNNQNQNSNPSGSSGSSINSNNVNNNNINNANDDGDNDINSTAGDVVGEFNTTSNSDVLVNSCESDWVCSEWTECINFQQKRVCIDANNCDLEDGPENTRSCELTDVELGLVPDNGNFRNRLTGFASGVGDVSSSWIGLIVLFSIIGSLFYFLLFRKKKV